MLKKQFASRETKIEYACGCTTTLIEAIRVAANSSTSCSSHAAPVHLVTQRTEYPQVQAVVSEDPVLSSYGEVDT